MEFGILFGTFKKNSIKNKSLKKKNSMEKEDVWIEQIWTLINTMYAYQFINNKTVLY